MLFLLQEQHPFVGFTLSAKRQFLKANQSDKKEIGKRIAVEEKIDGKPKTVLG